MRIALGADHAGYSLKRTLAEFVRGLGHEVLDVGTYKLTPRDDYVDYAVAVGRSVASGNARRGIVLCGSGVGATIAANKLKGIRACVCHDAYSARQGVEHDDVNVLVLGARVIGPALAETLVATFLSAVFTSEDRHVRRLNKVNLLDAVRKQVDANGSKAGWKQIEAKEWKERTCPR